MIRNSAILLVLLSAACGTTPAPVPPEPPPPEPSLAYRAWPLAQTWIRDALQLRDRGKRQEAIDAIRTGLEGSDPERRAAAVQALAGLRELTVDMAPFRPLIRAQFASESRAIRVHAVRALRVAGPEEGDLDLVLRLLEDPEPWYLSSILREIRFFSGGTLPAAAEAKVLEMLDSDDPRTVREALSVLPAGNLPAPVYARVLDLANRPDSRRDVIDLSLSPMRDKPVAVVKVLAEAMRDADPELRRRARWGLRSALPKDSRPIAADAFLDQLEAPLDTSIRDDCLRALRIHGGERHLASLEGYRGDDRLSASDHEMLEEAIRAIRHRLAR